MLDLRLGDCLEVLRGMEDNSVHCCVTSPPYYGLRDYGMDGQIGLEPTPDEYVSRMVAVFREVRRVLRDDGTCWVNLGDSYASTKIGNTNGTGKTTLGLVGGQGTFEAAKRAGEELHTASKNIKRKTPRGLKPKDLIGIPWRVAFALQADGWYLRQDIIWAKSNPMPESVRDRCTKSHEYIFLLTKSARYFYDHEAVKEPSLYPPGTRQNVEKGGFNSKYSEGSGRKGDESFRAIREKRNRRSVWTVATRPYSGAHFAVFPPQLIEPCILAGCPVGGTVLDPFAGSGTTGAVALTHDRQFIGIELNPEYLELAKQRIETAKTQPAPKPKRTPKPKAPDLEQRVESLEFRQHGMADNVRRMESAGQMSLFG